jgi:hypothetical protein
VTQISEETRPADSSHAGAKPLPRLGLDYALTGYRWTLPIQLRNSFSPDLVTECKASHAIVAKTIELAHLLDLIVICEGVETAEQNREVTALSGDFSEGFYLSRPMAAEMIDDITGLVPSAQEGASSGRSLWQTRGGSQNVRSPHRTFRRSPIHCHTPRGLNEVAQMLADGTISSAPRLLLPTRARRSKRFVTLAYKARPSSAFRRYGTH